MENNKSRFSLTSILVMLFCLISCNKGDISAVSPQYSANQPTIDPRPITSTSALIITEITPVPIFLIPAISNSNETYLTKSLQMETCLLPCYLGIQPGVTSWRDAQQILFNSGAQYTGHYYEDGTGMQGYEYNLQIGIYETIEGTQVADTDALPIEIFQSTTFLIEDSLVQRILVSVYTFNQELKLHRHWSRYFPREIFMSLGMPDLIYIGQIQRVGDGSSMNLIYKSRGVILQFESVREGEAVCPNFQGNGYNNLHFILTSTTSDLNIFTPGYQEHLINKNMWLSVPEAFGLSNEEFYDQIIKEPSVCFNMK